MTKRLFALLLCLVLVVSLVGCGDKNPTKTDVEDVVVISQVSETVDVVSEVESNASVVQIESDAKTASTSSKTSTVSKTESKTTTNLTTEVSSDAKKEPTIPFVSSVTITDTSEIVGTPIDFSIGVNAEIGTGGESDPFIATTYSQLVDKCVAVDDIYDEYNKNYIQKYDEKFFEENAVVVMFYTDGILRDKWPITIENVTVNEDTVYVNQMTVKEEPNPDEVYADVMSYLRICIEVKKADISKVTKLATTNRVVEQ